MSVSMYSLQLMKARGIDSHFPRVYLLISVFLIKYKYHHNASENYGVQVDNLVQQPARQK